jgi:hypothetical protein
VSAADDKRKPWLKFFGRDWRSSAKLRLCSPLARAVWIDMITLMAEARPAGFLLVDGVPPTADELASLIGTPAREVRRALAELAGKRVYSIVGQPMADDVACLIPGAIPKGVILSRRMVRDEAKAVKDRENGRGGGNPTLKRGVNPAGYRSESRDQRLDSQASLTRRAAPRASAPDGARAGPSVREPLRLTGAYSRGTFLMQAHRPGEAWKQANGPSPESGEDNRLLDDDQRRQWRRYHGLPAEWHPRSSTERSTEAA